MSAAAPCEQHAKLSKDCLIYSNNPQFCNQTCCEFRCLSSPYNEQTFGWQIPNIHVSTNPQQWAAANVSHRCLLRPISRFLPIHGQNMFKDWQLSPKITSSSSSSSVVHSLSMFIMSSAQKSWMFFPLCILYIHRPSWMFHCSLKIAYLETMDLLRMVIYHNYSRLSWRINRP